MADVYASWHPALRPNSDDDIKHFEATRSQPAAPLSSDPVIPDDSAFEAAAGEDAHPVQDRTPTPSLEADPAQKPPELAASISWDEADDFNLESNVPAIEAADPSLHAISGNKDSDRQHGESTTADTNTVDPILFSGHDMDREHNPSNVADIESADPYHFDGNDDEDHNGGKAAETEAHSHTVESSALDWGELDNDADFDLGPTSQETGAPPPLDQNVSRSGEIDWSTLDDSEFPIGDAVTGNGKAVEVVSETKDDLAALWEAELGDDDFLAEPEANEPLELPTFDDDGAGFLDDAAEPAPPQPPAQPNPAPATSRYAPPSAAPVVQEQKPQGNPYLPQAPQFTDFSRPSQPNVPQSTSAAARAPGYFQPATIVPRPGSSSAQSFVDKTPAGYSSPYDLPDDFSVPRRRPAAHSTQAPAAGQVPTAPPRSTSLSSAPIGPARVSQAYAPKVLTPPSSSHGLPGSAGAYQLPPVSKALPQPPKEEFFADLPIVSRQRSGTPGRYTPQTPASMGGRPVAPPAMGPPSMFVGPPTMNHAQAQAPPTHFAPGMPQPLPQLQPPAKLAPYADDAHGTVRSATVPAPISNNYSPSPVQPIAPQGASKYAPASAGKPLPSVPPRYAAEPPQPVRQVQPFAPRTSSPLTFQTVPHATDDAQGHLSRPELAIPRLTSMPSQPPLETVAEDETQATPVTHFNAREDLVVERRNTPPIFHPKSGPSSIGSSPRRKSNYIPSAALVDPTFAPPIRSQTSSPGAIQTARASIPAINRPASAQGGLSPIQQHAPVGLPPRPLGPKQEDVIPPQDERISDPLERWRGHPVFVWGGSGSVVTAFPTYTPRYLPGMPGPQLKAGGGEFKVRSAASVMSDPLNLPQFPGPLKKGKKKELSAWLKAHTESMESNLQTLYPAIGQLQNPHQVRLSERLLLWKVMALLVEHDGILEGTPAVDEAVIALLSPPVNTSFPVAMAPGSVQPTGDILPDSPTPKELGVLRSHLCKGDRVKAVWHAVDERLWGPALLIASTLDKDIWKQVIQEFVRKEVRDKALAALFQVFAGNWDESVDELVSVSARAGFQMVSTANGSSEQQNALAGLERWRETLLLILSNRSPGDAQAVLGIGKILAGYGRFEAAHVCFLFARSHAFFGGADDTASTFTLVGGDPKFLGSDFGGNLESILLSEVYEYALSVAPTPITPIPHLQAYKLYHAEVLAENGFLTEAQQYADAINAIIHSKTKGSPFYNVIIMQAVDDLSKRLSEAPADPSGSWKPSMDKVSSSLWGKFNSFVIGDNDASPTPSVLGNDQGQFQALAGDTPPMSTAASNIDMYSAYQSGAPAPATNSRYAPSNVYSPRRSNEHGSRSKYEPVAAPNYQPRTSLESTRSSYEGRPSLEVTQPPSPKRVSSFSALPQAQPNGTAPSPLRAVDPFGQRPHSANPYQPAGNGDINRYSSYGNELNPSLQQHSGGHHQNGSAGKPQPTPVQHPAQPSSYEPSGSYEPPSYQPYEPTYQEEAAEESKDEDDEKPKPKTKSFMDDDDDDDLMARAAALKNEPKKDREVDEAFKKAAEADGKESKLNE
jgi:hypothetical protein